MARATFEASRCVDQTCRGEPGATKSREPERAVVATTVRAGPKKTPRSDPRGKPGDKGCAIAGREVGARAAHSLSIEGASDREKPRRVTTVGWKRSRRLSQNRWTSRAPRKRRAPVSSEGCDRGVRGTIMQASGRKKNAATIPAGSAEAMRSVVKRSHPRSRWAATRRVHARRRVGDAEPGKRQGTGARSLSCGKQRLDRTHL
jgi:hypothetical protein